MTKKWEEHRDAIISYYKEQHKPLREVQKVMEEMHGFRASVRAYRSRFDRWKVHKYNCRRRQGSTSNGEESPPTPHADEPELATMTPPPTPATYPAHPARRQQRRLAAQPPAAPVQRPRHGYYGQGFGGAASPPATVVSAGSSPVESSMSRRTSMSQHQGTLDFSASSPPNPQYLSFEGYHHQQHYPDPSPQYGHHPGGGLALPLGAGQNSMFVWSGTPYHMPDADIKPPRD